jgi:hypothetical protein
MTLPIKKKIGEKRVTNRKGIKPPDDSLFKNCTPFKIPSDNVDEVAVPLHPTDERLDPVAASHQSKILNADFKRIFQLADNGDESAIGLLVGTAMVTTEMLGILARKNPKLLHPWSTNQDVWPILIGKKAFIRGEQKKRPNQKESKPALHDWLIERLRLGENSPLRSGWHNTPASLAVLYMLQWLEENKDQLKLPRFSAQSSSRWFENGWKALLMVTNGKPEDNMFLRGIGQRQGQTKTDQTEVANPTRILESNIRDRIKGSMKSSFNTITKFWSET